MKHSPNLCAALLLGSLAALHAAPETQPPTNAQAQTLQVRRFQSGDRWCALGDSISVQTAMGRKCSMADKIRNQPYIRNQQIKYHELKSHESEFPGQQEEGVRAARQAGVIKPHQFSLNHVASPSAP